MISEKTHSKIIEKIGREGLLTNKTGLALDLGSGVGNEALALASLGFSVEAVDIDQKILSIIEQKKGSLPIKTLNKSIIDYSIEPNKYIVIIASNSLPFIADKATVTRTIESMVNGLKKDGVLYFTLFGPKDGWAKEKTMSFFDYEEVLKNLEGLPISLYHRSTEEGFGKKMNGETKYWHIHKFLYLKT